MLKGDNRQALTQEDYECLLHTAGEDWTQNKLTRVCQLQHLMPLVGIGVLTDNESAFVMDMFLLTNRAREPEQMGQEQMWRLEAIFKTHWHWVSKGDLNGKT